MELIEQKKHYNYAFNLLEIVDFYEKLCAPEIDFILVNEEEEYIVGIIDKPYYACYVIQPTEEKKVVDYYDIKIEDEDISERFHDSIEGYIFYCINTFFEFSYVSIRMHAQLWEFIYRYKKSLDGALYDIVIEYLDFCKQSGINQRLLSTYEQRSIPNLYEVFFNEENQNG